MNLGTNLSSSKNFTTEYYKILSKEFPDFLNDYINTKEMQHLSKSSISCGCNYTNIFKLKFFYTNLDHSIAVALIIWHFTHDKKQAIAGLLHDIATPAFKHCIDFLNGDHEFQESTEELTEKIISGSSEIMRLLNRDGIKIEEVVDYKLYPIADNDSPNLSSDRLEYTLANGFFWQPVWTLNEIKTIYDDLIVGVNELGNDELAFKSIDIATDFIKRASTIWPTWISTKDKISMQFIADTIFHMNEKGFISLEDLYVMSEEEIINKILNCEDSEISLRFSSFMSAEKVLESEEFIPSIYCKSIRSKKRYINPLVLVDNKYVRLSEVSFKAESMIFDFLALTFPKYGYLNIKDFD